MSSRQNIVDEQDEKIQKIVLKLQMKWKLMLLTSVYSLTHSLICLHNALVSNFKLVPGFRACFCLVLVYYVYLYTERFFKNQVFTRYVI